MLWLLVACYISDVEVNLGADPDGDGYGPEVDCGPLDAAVNPGADEVWYDGVDQDCSETSDYDQDGDGFASAVAPDELGLIGTDCDDLHAAVYAGAEEICEDGVVNDCNGLEEALVRCRWQGEFSLTGVGLKLVGENAHDQAGSSVSGIGDVDGDGRADILVGAIAHHGEDANSGAAYLLWSSGVLADVGVATDFGAADLSLIGEYRNGQAGSSVSGVGDIDDDGRADLFIGANGDSNKGGGAGGAYLFLSSRLPSFDGGRLDLRAADITFVGMMSGEHAGESLSSTISDEAGDATLLIIGAPDHGDALYEYGDTVYDTGAIYFITAATALSTHDTVLSLDDADAKLLGATHDSLGKAISGGGDVDGDGRADVLAGTNGNGAYLLLANTVADAVGTTIAPDDVDCWLTRDAEDGSAGSSVATAVTVEIDTLSPRHNRILSPKTGIVLV